MLSNYLGGYWKLPKPVCVDNLMTPFSSASPMATWLANGFAALRSRHFTCTAATGTNWLLLIGLARGKRLRLLPRSLGGEKWQPALYPCACPGRRDWL